MFDPLGRGGGYILLEKAFVMNSPGETDDGKRSIPDMPEDCRCNIEVVFYDLCFENLQLGEENLVQIRQFQLLFADLGEFGLQNLTFAVSCLGAIIMKMDLQVQHANIAR